MPHGEGKTDRPQPDEFAKLLEIELMQKRAVWAQTKARASRLRMLSLLFLMVVLILSAIAFFFFFSSGRAHQDSRGGAAEHREEVRTR